MKKEIENNFLNELKSIIHDWAISNQNGFGKCVNIKLIFDKSKNDFEMTVESEKRENDNYISESNKSSLYDSVRRFIDMANAEFSKHGKQIIQSFDVDYSKDHNNESVINGTVST